jgi:aminoglycoside phosphotransferase family enzyme/predicted kinase
VRAVVLAAQELDRIVDSLADPSAYPHPAEDVEVHHTHISVVFLAGDFAYKVKKPVDLGFLDFTTLERRRRFCRREVRLNRRLAPGVYLGVSPLVEDDGRIRAAEAFPPGEEPAPGEEAAGGRTAEYAVKMERLPDEATLRRRLRRGDLRPADVERVGRRIARFHGEADAGPEISRYGRFEVVAGNARENFEQTTGHVGRTVSERVHGRLRELNEEALDRLRPLIEDRARRDVPRDTHGDLHLDHVYLFRDREPPEDLIVLDCIEFTERFRYGDPISDAGFLVMDLAFEGRRDLADRLAETYLRASGDEEGRRLLPFYTAYRAAVRAKVEGMAVDDPDLPTEEREPALHRARAHWLLALGELEPPGRRPCLVLLGGLPATGKTTLAEGLAREAGFRVISSDRTRKELAGLPPEADASADWEEGIYTPEMSDRTYSACREAVERALFRGERVLVDASFRSEERRRRFLETARRWGVPVLWVVCRAEDATVRDRLDRRREGGSDAGREEYLRAAESWDEPGEEMRRVMRTVSTDGSEASARDDALGHLREAGLHEGR